MQHAAGTPRLAEQRCPSCGNRVLPEFSQPAGLAVCPQCGTLVRRAGRKLLPVGVTSETVSKLIRSRMRSDIDRQRMEDRVRDVIATQLGVDKDVVQPETHFVNDLGADSLDVVELVMALEEEFGVDIDVD